MVLTFNQAMCGGMASLKHIMKAFNVLVYKIAIKDEIVNNKILTHEVV